MLNKDILAGIALQFNAMYNSLDGLCGVHTFNHQAEVQMTPEGLQELFGDEKAEYSKLDGITPNYYKEYKYCGVKFYCLISKEEYEDATF